MSFKPIYEMLADYNLWANRRLYDAAAQLGDAGYRADRGAFFGSLRGTLNHLVVADRVWLRRFTGEGPEPARLDDVVADDLPTLRAIRDAEDGRIRSYIAGLTEDALAAPLRYRMLSRPTDVVQPLWSALSHFFNHQAHHRGQAHALLTSVGGRGAAPELDLLLFQRETGSATV